MKRETILPDESYNTAKRGFSVSNSLAAIRTAKLTQLVRSRRHRVGLVGLGIVVLMVLFALVGPLLIPYDANTINLDARLEPLWTRVDGHLHVFGTDSLGRDVTARLAAGARSSLAVVTFSLCLGGVIGLVLGITAGLTGGWRDVLIMRLADAWLSLPVFVFAMLMAAVFGGGFRNTVLSIGLATWSYYARLVRGEVMRVRDTEYVQAARAVGVSTARLVRSYILPNILGVLAVIGTLELGKLILVESALSFVGLGLQPPDASWGSMIRQGQAYVFTAWWIPTVPGVFIMLMVLGMNFMGDWLRDILDPRTRRE